mgnify:CR=1 FL=1
MTRHVIIMAVLAWACCGGSVAGQNLPLGEVLSGGDVLVGNTPMPKGAILFYGDRIQAGREPSVLQLENRGLLQLFPGAVLSVTKPAEELSIQIDAGKVAFAFPKNSQVRLAAGQSDARLAGTRDRYYGAIERGDTRDTLQSWQGELALTDTVSGETGTLKAGQQAIVGSTAESGQGEPIEKKRRRAIIYIAVGGGAAATGIILWQVLRESEPEQVVSPS